MARLNDLFASHPHLRAVIDAVLEGRQGTIVTFDDPPRAARLELGCYVIPGGDPTTSIARLALAGLTGPLELVVPDDDRWRRLLAETFGDRLEDRPMRAYLPEYLEPDRLDGQARRFPDGYRLAEIGIAEAAGIGDELSPHGIDVFGGPDEFVRRGFGVCAVRDGVVACAATTYSLSAAKAEVAIATHADHRGQGLANAVSAAMLATCLRRGVEPHWNASNPVSQRLALRLGFVQVGVCEISMLDGT